MLEVHHRKFGPPKVYYSPSKGVRYRIEIANAGFRLWIGSIDKKVKKGHKWVNTTGLWALRPRSYYKTLPLKECPHIEEIQNAVRENIAQIVQLEATF